MRFKFLILQLSGIWIIIIKMFQTEHNLDIQGSGILIKNGKFLSCSFRRKYICGTMYYVPLYYEQAAQKNRKQTNNQKNSGNN